jgi:hypothetical protein
LLGAPEVSSGAKLCDDLELALLVRGNVRNFLFLLVELILKEFC